MTYQQSAKLPQPGVGTLHNPICLVRVGALGFADAKPLLDGTRCPCRKVSSHPIAQSNPGSPAKHTQRPAKVVFLSALEAAPAGLR